MAGDEQLTPIRLTPPPISTWAGVSCVGGIVILTKWKSIEMIAHPLNKNPKNV